jgi:hypothetical protein
LKRILALTALLSVLSGSASASGIEGGAFTTTNDKGPGTPAAITPAIQLPRNKTMPFPCSAKTDGTIALNSRAYLCICNGKEWTAADTTAACEWSPDKQ